MLFFADDRARLVQSRLSLSNRQSVSRFLYILVAVVALVLLIACLDITGLLLVRAGSRQKEIAVRMALGSGRWCIMRQLLVEVALISGLGLLASVPVAAWSVKPLSTVYLPFEVPLHVDATVDGRVMAFASALNWPLAFFFVGRRTCRELLPCPPCQQRRPGLGPSLGVSIGRSRISSFDRKRHILVTGVLIATLRFSELKAQAQLEDPFRRSHRKANRSACRPLAVDAHELDADTVAIGDAD